MCNRPEHTGVRVCLRISKPALDDQKRKKIAKKQTYKKFDYRHLLTRLGRRTKFQGAQMESSNLRGARYDAAQSWHARKGVGRTLDRKGVKHQLAMYWPNVVATDARAPRTSQCPSQIRHLYDTIAHTLAVPPRSSDRCTAQLGPQGPVNSTRHKITTATGHRRYLAPRIRG